MAYDKSKKTSSSSSSFNPKKRKGSPSTPTTPTTTTSATKRALKQERQLHRKHADIVIEAKQLWNKLRLKTNTKEEQRQLVKELAILIKGKAPEIVLQHDASRVVQAVLQFGNNNERIQILQELCSIDSSSSSSSTTNTTTNQKKQQKQQPATTVVSSSYSLPELAKNQYAHFVVLKSIKYGVHSPECITMIVKAFKGHIPKLAVHTTASKVIEALFQTFPNKSTAVLKQEFYGPHFALFASDIVALNDTNTIGATKTATNKNNNNTATPDLTYHLQQSPDKKDITLSFVRNIINRGMEKSLYGYTFFQNLFAEYIDNTSSNDIRDIASIVVDHSIHLLSSKAGTKVVAACATYGTAKDRKRIQKGLKGFSKSALLHRDAYLAILRLVQVTDDTVSTNKNIFQELLTSSSSKDKDDGGDGADDNDKEATTSKPTLLELALNDRACKLFLMLLITNDFSWKKLFDPYELSIMQDTNPTVTVTENGKTVEVPTSKKDSETRREELMQHLQKPLIEICINHTQELMFSLPGSALIREVYHSFHPQGLVDAVVDLCESELKADDDKEGLFEDRVGHLAIKNLILCDVELDDDDDNDTKKSSTTSKGASIANSVFLKFQDQLLEVAKSNRGAFVLSALCKVPSVKDDVVKILKNKTAKLKKLADKSTASAGYEALLKEIA